MNYDKSALTFSPSTTTHNVNAKQRIFSIEVVKGHDLYLGLPTFFLRSKQIHFARKVA